MYRIVLAIREKCDFYRINGNVTWNIANSSFSRYRRDADSEQQVSGGKKSQQKTIRERITGNWQKIREN